MLPLHFKFMYFHKGLDELSDEQTAALRAALLERLPSLNACIAARIEEIRASVRDETRRQVGQIGETKDGHHVREHSRTRNPHVTMRRNKLHEEEAELERALVEGEVALRKMERNTVINDNVRAITWDCFRVGLDTLFGDLKQLLLELEAREDKSVFVRGRPSNLHIDLYFRLVVLLLQSKYLSNDRFLELTRIISMHSFQAIKLSCRRRPATLIRPVAGSRLHALGINPDQILLDLIKKAQELGMLDPKVKRAEYCARLHQAEAEMNTRK